MKIQKITKSKKTFNMTNTVEDLLNEFWKVQQKANEMNDKVEDHFDEIVNEALEMFMKNDKEYKLYQKELKASRKKKNVSEEPQEKTEEEQETNSSANEYSRNV